MVNQQTVFEVLASISEVNAQQFSVAARSGIANAWEDTYNLATEDGGVVAHDGVTAHHDGLVRQVNCVVVPVSVNDDGYMCTVANDESKVISVGAGAFVLDNQGHFSVTANIKGGRAEGNVALASARDGDLDWLIGASFRVNGD